MTFVFVSGEQTKYPKNILHYQDKLPFQYKNASEVTSWVLLTGDTYHFVICITELTGFHHTLLNTVIGYDAIDKSV